MLAQQARLRSRRVCLGVPKEVLTNQTCLESMGSRAGAV